ncbi:MAG: hypothetical protein ACREGK_01515, partial [Geminicoccales bacterium]
MQVRSLVACFGCSLFAVAVTGALPPEARADHRGAPAAVSKHHQQGSEQKNSAGEFVKLVREATRPFQDVALAESAGYHLAFGCVSGPDVGAMGL